jgi:hypothetical protein
MFAHPVARSLPQQDLCQNEDTLVQEFLGSFGGPVLAN